MRYDVQWFNIINEHEGVSDVLLKDAYWGGLWTLKIKPRTLWLGVKHLSPNTFPRNMKILIKCV